MDDQRKIELTTQQLQAIDLIATHRLAIISGKPGTGKTTVLKEILSRATAADLDFALAAPTGKAAKRMTEATGHQATTIHSLLGCLFDQGKFKFIHGTDNQFRYDLIVLDEMSMVTTSLFASLLEAIDPRKTRLLLIGDPGQLPSIGAGAVLRDMIESEAIPHVELDQIHRNCGAIVSACAAIHAGKSFRPAKKFDFDAENPVNLIHIEKSLDFEIQRVIEQLVTKAMPDKGFDPIADIQVISPVNTRGALSCEKLNRILQVKLNPNADYGVDIGANSGDDSSSSSPNKFFIGDKVIQTKNKFVASATPLEDDIISGPENPEYIIGKDDKEIYIVNGDIGTVLSFTEKKIIVGFTDPPRTVAISQHDNQLLLAYAITCHRMQGSEAPVVIIPVHTAFQFFCNRQWIYTAISRAKTACVLVGQFAAVLKMVANVTGGDRKTMLRELLTGEVNSLPWCDGTAMQKMVKGMDEEEFQELLELDI